MFISYNYLEIPQKEMVTTKVATRTKAPASTVQIVLELLNPRVKIVNKEVIIVYQMLKRIKEEIEYKREKPITDRYQVTAKS